MKLTRLKISARLMGGFGMLSALMVLLGMAAIFCLQAIDRRFDSAMGDHYSALQIAHDIGIASDAAAQALHDLFIVTDAGQVKALYGLVAAGSSGSGVGIEKLSTLVDGAEGKAAMASLMAAHAACQVPRDKVVALLRAGERDEAKNVMVRDLRPRQAAYMGQLQALIRHQDRLMLGASDEVSRTLGRAKTAIGLLLVVVFALALVMATRITRSVVGTLTEATLMARGVTDGKLAIAAARRAAG